MADAANENWSKVAPPIFGTLFQSSMGKERRHAYGAHFTHEADIQKVVLPTIVRPWRQRIEATSSLKDLLALSKELLDFRVLDPACGSGNFLYVAYRELVNLEMEILAKIHDKFGQRARRAVGTASLVSTKQFYGIDKDEFAVELAKVTLMLGKRIALAETHDSWFAARSELPFTFEEPLPLDNLDDNIQCDDALFCRWPEADAIIGNPPYQSKNKMQREFGRAYLNRIRTRYSDVPGRADYCVYWFRRAHDEIPKDGRAGLVGTNTIRQNYSRQGGLDYIVKNNGTITEAVSTQAWSGDAAVSVSIVNWIKGEQDGRKRLFRQLGDQSDSPWEITELDHIGAALSGRFDVTDAANLRANRDSDTCDQGQTPGNSAFVLTPRQRAEMLRQSPRNGDVIFPYLGGEELLSTVPPSPNRFIIDFSGHDVISAGQYEAPFLRVKEMVLPLREANASEEQQRNEEARADNPRARVNWHHRNFLRRWWQLSYAREGLLDKLTRLPRYIVCVRVTKRPVFEFIRSTVHPGDALQVFTFDDDYSFGILQSDIHWTWFVERCSTLTERFRYTSNTVYDSFPWPQAPTIKQVRAVAHASSALRILRNQLIADNEMNLRELYRTLELPGDNPLKQAHNKLDQAVREAYGFGKRDGILDSLFTLNKELAEREAHMQSIVGPGLPPSVADSSGFVTLDCVTMADATTSRRFSPQT